jgi:hypothetical protein
MEVKLWRMKDDTLFLCVPMAVVHVEGDSLKKTPSIFMFVPM